MKFAPAIAPGENDPVVRKPRMNAFYSSELQSMLNARSVDTLVLSGVSTGFVVESTARYAVDADYRVIVLEDCCGASSAEDHARAIASMTPLVHVASSDDFLASLG
jgi:nicotinamidase-related amidase